MYSVFVNVKNNKALNKKVEKFLEKAPEYELLSVQFLGEYEDGETYFVVYREHGRRSVH